MKACAQISIAILAKLQSPMLVGIVYAVSAVWIAMQRFYLADYNNYKIFQAAFWHLQLNTNLHAPSPSEYFDQFLYAPPAAVMLAPLHYLSTFWGMIAWVLATAMGVFFSIKWLPIGARERALVWWIVWLEMMTALHNQQTNPWLLTFSLLTLLFYERGQGMRAAAFPILGFFVKGFGGLGGFLLFFYPKFWKNGFSYLFWIAVIGASPALVVGFDALPQLYTDWFVCLSDDHGATEKEQHLMSLMHLINAFSPVTIPFSNIQISGVLAMVAMLGYTRFFKKNTLWLRLNVLSYLLMWVILFNHAAESNTHVISVGGAALWYATACTNGILFKNNSRINNFLILFVLVLTCLGATDLMPTFIREQYIFVYALKALPIFCVWLKLQWDMVFRAQ